MTMTQHEISMYVIEVERFKKGHFNDSDLAELLQHYTGLKESSFEWTGLNHLQTNNKWTELKRQLTSAKWNKNK